MAVSFHKTGAMCKTLLTVNEKCIHIGLRYKGFALWASARNCTRRSQKLGTRVSEQLKLQADDSACRGVYGVGLRPLDCWDYGFESRRGHMSVAGVYCVLSSRGPCNGQITRSQKSYRVRCVWVWQRNLTEEIQAQRGCPAMKTILQAVNWYALTTAERHWIADNK